MGEQNTRRLWRELGAILLIGDAALGLLEPERHCEVWAVGPRRWRGAMLWFAERPGLVRVLSVLEASAGLALALRRSDAGSVASGGGRGH